MAISKAKQRQLEAKRFFHKMEPYGIKRSYFAKILGISRQGFDYKIKNGLTEVEAEILDGHIKAIGVLFSKLSIPRELVKEGDE